MELGGCVRAPVGTTLFILSSSFVRHSVCSSFTENTADQCSSKADFLEFSISVYISRRSHFSVPGWLRAVTSLNNLQSIFSFLAAAFTSLSHFQVLLANKLDGDISTNYTTVAMPLIVSHITLIFMSFGAKGGNKCETMRLLSFI